MYGSLRGLYNEASLMASVRFLNKGELLGAYTYRGWATGIKFYPLPKKWNPYIGLGYNFTKNDRIEYGPPPNDTLYTYYSIPQIKYLVPEIGILRNVFSADSSGFQGSVSAGISYRLSEGGNNTVTYISGPPVKNSFIKQANLEIADGWGINLGVQFFFLRNKKKGQ